MCVGDVVFSWYRLMCMTLYGNTVTGWKIIFVPLVLIIVMSNVVVYGFHYGIHLYS